MANEFKLPYNDFDKAMENFNPPNESDWIYALRAARRISFMQGFGAGALAMLMVAIFTIPYIYS